VSLLTFLNTCHECLQKSWLAPTILEQEDGVYVMGFEEMLMLEARTERNEGVNIYTWPRVPACSWDNMFRSIFVAAKQYTNKLPTGMRSFQSSAPSRASSSNYPGGVKRQALCSHRPQQV